MLIRLLPFMLHLLNSQRINETQQQKIWGRFGKVHEFESNSLTCFEESWIERYLRMIVTSIDVVDTVRYLSLAENSYLRYFKGHTAQYVLVLILLASAECLESSRWPFLPQTMASCQPLRTTLCDCGICARRLRWYVSANCLAWFHAIWLKFRASSTRWNESQCASILLASCWPLLLQSIRLVFTIEEILRRFVCLLEYILNMLWAN
jgi:hypothetical protein